MVERRRQTRRRWLGTCTGVAGITALAGCSGSQETSGDGDGTKNSENGTGSLGEDWPMYGVDLQNTAHHPTATGPDGDEVTVRAVADIGGISNYPVVVSDGMLYGHSTAGNVYAMDIATEEIEWTWERSGPPTVFDETIYGPLLDQTLYGYDVETGEQWKSEQNDRIDGLVCRAIPTSDGIFVASHEMVWRVDPETGDWTHVVDTPIETRGTTDWPAFHDGTLYIGRMPDLYAIDIDEQTVEWTFQTDNGESIIASNPTVANGMVYGASTDEKLHALDSDSGEEVWNADINRGAGTSPAVANDNVYIAGPRHLLAVDAETGDLEWESGEDITLEPEDVVVAEGVCYVTTSYRIWAYDAGSGDLIWKYERPNEENLSFSAPPTIYNGTVYVPSVDDTLYAIEDA